MNDATSAPADQSPSARRRATKLATLLLVIAVAVPTLATAIALWQEHTESAAALAERRDREAHSIRPDNPPGPESFYPIEVVDRQPVVEGFRLINADDLQNTPRDDELVLAVRIGDEARAWPLNVMTGPAREIFNDQLGGRSIAATW